MHVLFVDDEKKIRVEMEDSLERLGHTVSLKSNGEQALAISEAELCKIDVAIIDQRLPGGIDGLKVGEGLKQRKPDLVLIMLTAHGSVDFLVRLLREGLFRDFLSKPLDDGDLETSLLRVEPEIKLRRENEWLRQQIDAQRPGQYLFEHTRHLVGINDIILHTAYAVRPFFMWLNGEWESIPEKYRPTFPTCLLFEGDPGAGKSALCKAIATAFDSVDTVLYRDLSPSDTPKKWKKPLLGKIEEFYKLAAERRVVIIRADDLLWPEVAKITDKALAADWSEYMYTMRDYMRDAGLINRGLRPEHPQVEKISKEFNGKILWLVARNTTEDVGAMFGPLESFMKPRVPVSFPRDMAARKQIFNYYVELAGFTFEPRALDLALRRLEKYTGRELIGDENAPGGFLNFVIERVKERELLRHQEGNTPEDTRIGIEEINQWLDTPEHKFIVDQGNDNQTTYTFASVTARSKCYRDGLDSIRTNLDIIEAMLEEGHTAADIGKAIYGPVKNPRNYLTNFWGNVGTQKVFRSTPENEARSRWPRVLNYVAYNHPKAVAKYPGYVKVQKFPKEGGTDGSSPLMR